MLCYNKFGFTKSALADLHQLTEDHEIIIIDNGSTDETQKELEDNSSIIYYRNDRNLGFSKGANQGYQLASAPNVLFLNNDIRVKSNYKDLTKPLLEYCPTHLVGPTMGQLDNNLNFVQEANKELSGKSYLSGWCLASSKTIFDKLKGNYKGPFSEEYFCYFEDTHLSFLAKKLGIPFKVVDLPVVHFGKITSKQLNTYSLYKEAQRIFINKWR